MVSELRLADAKLFTIEGGVLAFKDSPDYEKPGNCAGRYDCRQERIQRNDRKPPAAPTT